MTQTELIENFKTQQAQTLEDIKNLDAELNQKKELYVKLQGAIEGIELLSAKEENTETEEINSVL